VSTEVGREDAIFCLPTKLVKVVDLNRDRREEKKENLAPAAALQKSTMRPYTVHLLVLGLLAIITVARMEKQCSRSSTTQKAVPSPDCQCSVQGGIVVTGNLTVAELIASSAEVSAITSTDITNSGQFLNGGTITTLILDSGKAVIDNLAVCANGGSFAVGCSTNLSKSATVGGDLNVVGTIFAKDVETNSLSCNGASSIAFTCPAALANGSSVSGNLVVGQGLLVSGTVSAPGGITSSSISTSNISVRNMLTSTGPATLGTTTVCAGSMDTFTVDCAASLGGGTTIHGNLTVTGEVISDSVETGTIVATSSISTPSLIVNGQTCSCSGTPVVGFQYGYIYNTAAESVAVNAPVTFSSNGVLTSGITHDLSTSLIQVLISGTYEVTFSVSGSESNQFALFVNGTVVAGSVYGSGAGTQQNNGQVIVALGAGASLTLVNYISASAVELVASPPIGGTATVTNAAILIKQLA